LKDERGELLEFRPNDKILIIQQSGKLKVITPELSTHFDSDMVVLEKWVPKSQFQLFIMMEKKRYYIKRFF
jgi:topoisomerase-4 subunit A